MLVQSSLIYARRRLLGVRILSGGVDVEVSESISILLRRDNTEPVTHLVLKESVNDCNRNCNVHRVLHSPSSGNALLKT